MVLVKAELSKDVVAVATLAKAVDLGCHPKISPGYSASITDLDSTIVTVFMKYKLP